MAGTLLNEVWKRTGISTALTEYQSDIESYLTDALEDMKDSGVPESYIPESVDAEGTDDRVITAATLYVMAYLGTDRTDTEKYLDLYRKKVFRLTLLEDESETESEEDDGT